MNKPDTFTQTDLTPHPAAKQDKWKSRLSRIAPMVKSFLLFFCLLFSMRFWDLLFHEGGHTLPDSIDGNVTKILYVHPFAFSGFAGPGFKHSAIIYAAGPVIGLLVPLLIFILLWKNRSVALLPLIMVFPWVAMEQLANVTQIRQTSDYYNIILFTGLPEAAIVIPCLLLFFIGGFFLLLLMPLLGLGPKDWRVLLVLPAAVILWTGVSIGVAYLVIPGSPVDTVYHMGTSIIQNASGIGLFALPLVLLLGVSYLTFYRLIYERLPSWLKTETTLLTWKNLRIPALSAAVCVIVGLILIH